MQNTWYLARLAVAAAICCMPARVDAQEQPPRLRVGVLPEGVAIDGRLNEADWAAADAADAFAQAEPSEGGPPSGRTLVRVLAGPEALVIGIICRGSRPERHRQFQCAARCRAGF
jgi:hypothetical protein